MRATFLWRMLATSALSCAPREVAGSDCPDPVPARWDGIAAHAGPRPPSAPGDGRARSAGPALARLGSDPDTDHRLCLAREPPETRRAFDLHSVGAVDRVAVPGAARPALLSTPRDRPRGSGNRAVRLSRSVPTMRNSAVRSGTLRALARALHVDLDDLVAWEDRGGRPAGQRRPWRDGEGGRQEPAAPSVSPTRPPIPSGRTNLDLWVVAGAKPRAWASSWPAAATDEVG